MAGPKTSDELGLVAGTIETTPGQQVVGQTCNIPNQAVDQSLVKCSEGLSGRMSVDPGDGRPHDGQVVEISPTVYSENNMPRTVQASRFIMVVLKAQSLRTQM